MLAPILEQGCSESINPQMHESYMDTVSNHYVILCIHILDIQLQANNALKTNHQRPSTQLIKVATSVGNDGNWWDLDLLSHGKRARVQLLHTSWHYSIYVRYVHSDQHIMCTVLIPDIICIWYVYIIQPVYAWIYWLWHESLLSMKPSPNVKDLRGAGPLARSHHIQKACKQHSALVNVQNKKCPTGVWTLATAGLRLLWDGCRPRKEWSRWKVSLKSSQTLPCCSISSSEQLRYKPTIEGHEKCACLWRKYRHSTSRLYQSGNSSPTLYKVSVPAILHCQQFWWNALIRSDLWLYCLVPWVTKKMTSCIKVLHTWRFGMRFSEDLPPASFRRGLSYQIAST